MSTDTETQTTEIEAQDNSAGDDTTPLGGPERAKRFAAQLRGEEPAEAPTSEEDSQEPVSEEGTAPESMFDLVQEDDGSAPDGEEAGTSEQPGQATDGLTTIKEKLDLPADADVDSVLNAVVPRKAFTQKTQELQETIRQLQADNENAKAVYDLLKNDPSGLLNIAMEATEADSIDDVLAGLGVAAQPEDDGGEPAGDGSTPTPAPDLSEQVQAAVREALGVDPEEIKQMQAEREQQQAEQAVKAKFDEFAPELTEEQRQKVIKHAMDLGLTQVEQLPLAFNDLKAQWAERTKAAKQAAGTSPGKESLSGSGHQPSDDTEEYVAKLAESDNPLAKSFVKAKRVFS